MAERLELTLTIHGLDGFNQDVDGEVFARKLAAFMRGLAAADKAANGKRRYKFLITNLSRNTATASLREQVSVKGVQPDSGFRYFVSGVESIYKNTPQARSLPESFIKQMVSLGRGVERDFAFGEIKTNANFAIRIDDFFAARAEAVLDDVSDEISVLEIEEYRRNQQGFSGVSLTSYDGVLKAVDLRGTTQKATLVLTAGGEQIDCVVNALNVDKLREALDRRVLAYGMAHYEKTSGLPVRLDIKNVRLLPKRAASNLAKWRGQFKIPDNVLEEEAWW